MFRTFFFFAEWLHCSANTSNDLLLRRVHKYSGFHLILTMIVAMNYKILYRNHSTARLCFSTITPLLNSNKMKKAGLFATGKQ